MRKSSSRSEVFMEAIARGDINAVKKIMKRTSKLPMDDALVFAVQFNQPDIFDIVLPHANPLAQQSRALRAAAYMGSITFVKILTPLSDPLVLDSEALRLSCHCNDPEIFDWLYPLSNPGLALETMQKQGDSEQQMALLKTRLCAEGLKKDLSTQLSLPLNSAPTPQSLTKKM